MNGNVDCLDGCRRGHLDRTVRPVMIECIMIDKRRYALCATANKMGGGSI